MKKIMKMKKFLSTGVLLLALLLTEICFPFTYIANIIFFISFIYTKIFYLNFNIKI